MLFRELYSKIFKNKLNIFPIFILFFYILNVIATLLYNGFLNGHEGHAGPHILSVAINSIKSDIDVFHDEIEFGILANKISLYNHHPKLFFYIMRYFLSKFSLLSEMLKFSYLIVVTFNFLGIFQFYYLLLKIIKPYFAQFYSIALIGVINFSEFVNLTTFDSLSLTSIVTFCLFAFNYNSIKSIPSKIKWSVIILILSLISWYNVLFISVFLIIKFLKIFVSKPNYSNSYNSNFFIFLPFVISVILQIYFIIFYKSNYELIGHYGAKNFILFNKVSLTPLFLKNIIIYFLRSTPLLVLLLILFYFRSYHFSLFIKYLKTDLAITVIISVLLFHILDFNWNLRHQFFYIYGLFFLLLLISIIYKGAFINNKIYFIQIIISLFIFFQSSLLDLKTSLHSERVIFYFDGLSRSKFHSLDIKNGTSINESSENNLPTKFNKGELFIFKAYLNLLNRRNQLNKKSNCDVINKVHIYEF